MKHFRRLSIIFTLIVLSSVFCRAEDSIHTQSINSMFSAGTLVIPKPYKVGTTAFVTYTISGSDDAKFWTYGGTDIAICLPKNGDFVTTTKITNLERVWFTYSPSADYLYDVFPATPTMQILVSNDSTEWSNIASGATHSSSSADVLLPSAGDYYVRIKNTGSSKPIYIRVMNYTTQHCNCFRYQP